ncbi:hypothetical protein NMY22_g8400 [Coprinellus aureogranulatus]|nr:hypothetical protein NMY22_g8400 [Coprinellus aureogranulatus]
MTSTHKQPHLVIVRMHPYNFDIISKLDEQDDELVEEMDGNTRERFPSMCTCCQDDFLPCPGRSGWRGCHFCETKALQVIAPRTVRATSVPALTASGDSCAQTSTSGKCEFETSSAGEDLGFNTANFSVPAEYGVSLPQTRHNGNVRDAVPAVGSLHNINTFASSRESGDVGTYLQSFNALRYDAASNPTSGPTQNQSACFAATGSSLNVNTLATSHETSGAGTRQQSISLQGSTASPNRLGASASSQSASMFPTGSSLNVNAYATSLNMAPAEGIRIHSTPSRIWHRPPPIIRWRCSPPLSRHSLSHGFGTSGSNKIASASNSLVNPPQPQHEQTFCDAYSGLPPFDPLEFFSMFGGNYNVQTPTPNTTSTTNVNEVAHPLGGSIVPWTADDISNAAHTSQSSDTPPELGVLPERQARDFTLNFIGGLLNTIILRLSLLSDPSFLYQSTTRPRPFTDSPFLSPGTLTPQTGLDDGTMLDESSISPANTMTRKQMSLLDASLRQSFLRDIRSRVESFHG